MSITYYIFYIQIPCCILNYTIVSEKYTAYHIMKYILNSVSLYHPFQSMYSKNIRCITSIVYHIIDVLNNYVCSIFSIINTINISHIKFYVTYTIWKFLLQENFIFW